MYLNEKEKPPLRCGTDKGQRWKHGRNPIRNHNGTMPTSFILHLSRYPTFVPIQKDWISHKSNVTNIAFEECCILETICKIWMNE